jgi:hypothetical protein
VKQASALGAKGVGETRSFRAHALELHALLAQRSSTALLATLANRIPDQSQRARVGASPGVRLDRGVESPAGALRELVVDHLDLSDDVGQLLAQLPGDDASHHGPVLESRDHRCDTRLQGSAHDKITWNRRRAAAQSAGPIATSGSPRAL